MSRINLTPGRAIRRFCLECQGGMSKWREVEVCPERRPFVRAGKRSETKCPLWDWRLGKGRPGMAPIRDYCLHCNGVETDRDGALIMADGYRWAIDEAKNCTDPKCFLYKYRPGTRNYKATGRPFSSSPARAKSGSEGLDTTTGNDLVVGHLKG